MRTKLPMLVLCAALSGWVSPPMVRAQPKLPLWSETATSEQCSVFSDQLPVTNGQCRGEVSSPLPSEQSPEENNQLPGENDQLPAIRESSPAPSLPCLDSSKECIDRLTQAAHDLSPKLKTINERIALIDQRLEVMAQRIDRAKDKRWTNFITTDPVKIVQNIFGGGDMQRDRIAIADLEVKTADLEAARAELERQREEEKLDLGDRVLKLVLEIERIDRTIALIQSQQETFRLQNEVFRIQYRLGQGSTEQLLGMTTRGAKLNEQLMDATIKRDEAVRELGQLTGYGDKDIRAE